jgi:multicomponent Na+:H+ antiporter subunit C
MTAAALYAACGALLLASGFVGVAAARHILRKVLALNVTGSGVFLLLVGFAQRGGAADAVAHALVLTGIVVAVSATALALALLRRSGASRLPEDE